MDDPGFESQQVKETSLISKSSVAALGLTNFLFNAYRDLFPGDKVVEA
jgi:hypothetical protein